MTELKTPLVFQCEECNNNFRFKKTDPGEGSACPKCGDSGRLKFLYAEKPREEIPAPPPAPEESVEEHMTPVQAAHLEGFIAGYSNGFSGGYEQGFAHGYDEAVGQINAMHDEAGAPIEDVDD